MFEPSLAPAHSCTSATAGATARRARRLCMQRTSERQLLGRLGKLGSSARQAARLDYGAACGGRTVQPAMRTPCERTESTSSFRELSASRRSRTPLCAPHTTIGDARDRSALRTRTRQARPELLERRRVQLHRPQRHARPGWAPTRGDGSEPPGERPPARTAARLPPPRRVGSTPGRQPPRGVRHLCTYATLGPTLPSSKIVPYSG